MYTFPFLLYPLPDAEVGGGPSTKASEFYVGFLANQLVDPQALFLTITTDEPVPIDVTVMYLETTTNVTVQPYAAVRLLLPLDLKPTSVSDVRGNTREVNKGVYIKAANNRKVSVYGGNAAYASLDTFVASPAVSYSFFNPNVQYPYEYYIFSSGSDPDRAVGTDLPGFMVVASQNVNISYNVSNKYLTKDLYAPRPYRTAPLGIFSQITKPVNGFYNYIMALQQRQTYYFLGEKTDLTGISIKSSRPLAVYSGHSCGYVNNASCDHMVEQVTPTATWGKLFFSAPIGKRTGGDVYRVIAMASGTTITVTMSGSRGYVSSSTYNMQQGGMKELLIPQDTFITIESNKAVYVMQYQQGHVANNPTSSFGDPYMATIAPVEQYLNSYVVTSWDIKDFFKSALLASQFYLTIAVLKDFYDPKQIYMDNTTYDEATLDGTLKMDKWYPLFCADDQGGQSECGRSAIISIPEAGLSRYIRHTNPKAGLFVNVQGINEYISFGHSAGYEMEALQGQYS